ncbi:hypothetical protein JRQ81_009485 [Phrynocephalus forsythii]|uniref:Polo-like kinase 1 substrate 1 n=1 Tax=Phrynocephalus forsythii TaxID=171643 RepID=A0A9Q0X9V2_9SAUR|nr:hypothetical protein JRQ81_009485 [Phrynocephalus forsythii]
MVVHHYWLKEIPRQDGKWGMTIVWACRLQSQAGSSFAEQEGETQAQVAALSRLWNELCLRESRAQIRNAQLLRDFSALETRLADLSARTDVLRRRKRDYEKFLQHLRTDLQDAQGGDMRQGGLRPDLAKIPEGRPFQRFTAGKAIKSEEATGVSMNPTLSSGGCREEQNHMSLGLLRTSVGQDGSAPLVSFPDEVNSGHVVAERPPDLSPRQREMQAKRWDADTMSLNEPLTQVPMERYSGLLEHEAKEAELKEIWVQLERASEAQGDGGCREKQGRQEGRNDEKEGETAESPDLGRAQADLECEVPEGGPPSKELESIDSGLTEREDGLEPDQGKLGRASRAEECEVDDGEKVELWGPSHEGQNGRSRLKAQEGVSVEEEGTQEGRHTEGGKENGEGGRQDGPNSGEPNGAEGGWDGNHGQETGSKWASGSQTEEAGGPEEDAESSSSGLVLVSLRPRNHGTSEQEGDHEKTKPPSVQKDHPMEARLTQAELWDDTVDTSNIGIRDDKDDFYD